MNPIEIKIDYEEIDRAIAIVEDYIFSKEQSYSDQDNLKLLKLLKARESNPRFDYDLAEMICGDDGNSFPYRSSYYLTLFFQNLGHKFQHDGTTRRYWVESQLKRLNIKDVASIIRKGLFNKRDFRIYAKKEGLDFENIYKHAIDEFREFIKDSIDIDEELDLSYLLNMNVNVDLLFNQESTTNDIELNQLISESKSRFLNPNDKQIALEKIWDAFERIKTYYSTNKKKSIKELISNITTDLDEEEIEAEFKTLTKIGNEYRIRHHEKGKKEITNQDEMSYLYFRVLSLIDLCINKIND